MSDIGERIKARREELGLTQDELAVRAGYSSRSTINKIEMGTRDIPRKKIAVLAAALDTTPEALAGWSSSVEESPDDIFLKYIRSLGCDFVWEDPEHAPAVFYGKGKFFAERDSFASLKKKIDEYSLDMIKSMLMDLKTFDQVFEEQKEAIRKRLQNK